MKTKRFGMVHLMHGTGQMKWLEAAEFDEPIVGFDLYFSDEQAKRARNWMKVARRGQYFSVRGWFIFCSEDGVPLVDNRLLFYLDESRKLEIGVAKNLFYQIQDEHGELTAWQKLADRLEHITNDTLAQLHTLLEA